MTSKVKTPPNPTMVADLHAAANLLGTNIVASMTKGKTYEAWIMFEVALAVASTPTSDPTPITTTPRQHDGQPATLKFTVRGGPGHIKPTSPYLTNGACHFEFARHGRAIELHASVQHMGMSGTDHELDLSVMPKSRVDIVRASGGGSFDGFRFSGIELKAYDGTATLNKNIARAFVALAGDLDPPMTMPRIAKATPSGTVTSHWHRSYHPHYWLITTADISLPTEAYLDWYDIEHAKMIDVPTSGVPTPVAQIAWFICHQL